MTRTRRLRNRCGATFVACCAALATSPSDGFTASYPTVSKERRAPRASSAQLGRVHGRSGLRLEGRLRRGRPSEDCSSTVGEGWALFSENESGHERESATAVGTHSEQPRRYVGADAGASDHGVGGPTGDGRGKEWTVDLCSKRLSLLQRKLRQVKTLLAKQAKDPDSLDAAQLVKLDRKMDLQVEIAELEALRRQLRAGEMSSSSTNDEKPPAEARQSRLPPGPFAGGINSPAYNDQPPQASKRGERIGDDGETYTREGLKLASPRRPAPSTMAPSIPATAQHIPPRTDPRDEQPTKSHERPSTPIAASARTGGEEEFDWAQDDDEEEKDVKELDSPEGVYARSDIAAPSGGYPKRLSGLLSFCRVSDKETCEILVAMGRVTVNGEVVEDPGIKVDILSDTIVASGVAVSLPEKIDNSDETRLRRDTAKRTGPIPKSEKNTWKKKTKYRWNLDEGLLATRTRKAATAKTLAKKKGGGGRDGGEGGFW